MLPVLIGGAVGLFLSAKHEEKKARDQQAFVESAGDALKSFQEGNYAETQGMFDDADSDDGSLENSLLELLSLEDGKNLPFVFIKEINGEDSLVFGLYDTETQAIDTDSIELSRMEQAVVRDSLINGTYDLETVGQAENIRVISMENEAPASSGVETASSSGAEDFFNRGEAYYEKGQYDQAIKDLTEAIRLDTNYLPAYGFRGEAYHTKGQYDMAIKDFSKVIKLDPNFIRAYGCRGEAFRMKNLWDLAIKDFNEAIRLDPNYAFAYACRGDAYRMKGQYDMAFKDLSKAIRLDRNYAFAYACRGEANRMIGQYDRAIKDLTEALRLDPDNEWAKARLKETRGN